MVTQDQQVKQPVYMPTADNAAGNESGTTTLISGGDHTVPYSGNNLGINISASAENRSAKFKYGEGGPSQEVPEAGRNQYQ